MSGGKLIKLNDHDIIEVEGSSVEYMTKRPSRKAAYTNGLIEIVEAVAVSIVLVAGGVSIFYYMVRGVIVSFQGPPAATEVIYRK